MKREYCTLEECIALKKEGYPQHSVGMFIDENGSRISANRYSNWQDWVNSVGQVAGVANHVSKHYACPTKKQAANWKQSKAEGV